MTSNWWRCSFKSASSVCTQMVIKAAETIGRVYPQRFATLPAVSGSPIILLVDLHPSILPPSFYLCTATSAAGYPVDSTKGKQNEQILVCLTIFYFVELICCYSCLFHNSMQVLVLSRDWHHKADGNSIDLGHRYSCKASHSRCGCLFGFPVRNPNYCYADADSLLPFLPLTIKNNTANRDWYCHPLTNYIILSCVMGLGKF